MLLLQKDFKIEKKTLYSYKDKAGTFEKYQHNQSHKTAVLRQFTLPWNKHSKVLEMHNKSIGTERNGKRQVLLAILENIRFLDKMFQYFLDSV